MYEFTSYIKKQSMHQPPQNPYPSGSDIYTVMYTIISPTGVRY